MGRNMSYSRWGESNWYIFWSDASTTKNESKCDQVLAIWYAGSEYNNDYTYLQVLDMYETKNWSNIAPDMEIDDLYVLEHSLKRWLDNVEEDFPDTPPTLFTQEELDKIKNDTEMKFPSVFKSNPTSYGEDVLYTEEEIDRLLNN